MRMGELVRYYLLAISARGYNFNKTISTINKSGTIRNSGISTFWAQNIVLKKLDKFV